MASAALSRALRRPLLLSASRHVMNLHLQVANGRQSYYRQFSFFNDFSHKLKGEANSNTEFQQSIKELNEKIKVLRDDLKVRTQKATEKLDKKVDDVWTKAEVVSKKVSEDVREQTSAAKEEVKETLGLGKQDPSTSSSNSTSTSGPNGGNTAASGAEKSQGFEAKNDKESPGQPETIFAMFKDTISSTYPKIPQACQKMKETKISNLAMKSYNIVKDELSYNQSTKKRMQYASASVSSEPRSTKTDIVVLPSKKSILGDKWEAFEKKMQGHPIFKPISGCSQPVVTKGQEIAEDMREWWETSDSPVVHKIQEKFDSGIHFVFEVQDMIRPVLTAYFKGDVETLKKYCTPEVIERCKGERMANEIQGTFFDNMILYISEVDVRETKTMGSSPLIIVAMYCVRDREGSISAGGKDTIQTVLYAWAMHQIDAEELGEGAYYPQWRLREMQQLGFQALI